MSKTDDFTPVYPCQQEDPCEELERQLRNIAAIADSAHARIDNNFGDYLEWLKKADVRLTALEQRVAELYAEEAERLRLKINADIDERAGVKTCPTDPDPDPDDFRDWPPRRVAQELRKGDRLCLSPSKQPLTVISRAGRWLWIGRPNVHPATFSEHELGNLCVRFLSRAPVKPLHERVCLGTRVRDKRREKSTIWSVLTLSKRPGEEKIEVNNGVITRSFDFNKFDENWEEAEDE